MAARFKLTVLPSTTPPDRETNTMNTIARLARLLLIACLLVPLAACDKADDKSKEAPKPALSAPVNDDAAAWRAYVTDVVGRNMEGVTSSPFVYLLPSENSADFQGSYDRLLDKAQSDISRGILGGNMLAYASPSSTKTADLIVSTFEAAKPDKLKGVKLLFIGKPEDNERVKTAVAISGVNYVFVEAK
ncbi:MAG: hypothetical protein E6Q88_07930 [Lysobacteraceae bacterium]|nr:MAG: hypothetical protein E6Q88_07930 [Xanthomonadaceae bacterium]